MKTLATFCFFFFAVLACSAQDTTFKQYVGKYSFPDGSPVTSAEVILNGAELSVNSSAGASVLDKRGKDTFYLTAFDGFVYFLRTEGKVSGMRVDVQGNVFEGVKVPSATAWIQRKEGILNNRRMAIK